VEKSGGGVDMEQDAVKVAVVVSIMDWEMLGSIAHGERSSITLLDSPFSNNVILVVYIFALH
jgi:hypothetical protein